MELRDRLRGRAPARGRQAGGHRRPSGAGPREGTLVHGLLEHGAEGGEEADRPGIVHRLDRDTSGLLVVARSEEAYERLRSLVADRELERTYLALVRGRPRSRRGPDRSADRPRPQRSAPALARHGHAARGDHALRGRAAARPPCASARAARDRPDAPDPRPPGARSACRSRATGSTASPSRGSRASSCTRPSSPSRTRSPASAWRRSSPLPDDLGGVPRLRLELAKMARSCSRPGGRTGGRCRSCASGSIRAPAG